MRFLIDRCAGRRIAEWLLQEGYDALHIGDLGPDPGDERVLGIAAAQQRILITIDSDFGRLVFQEAAAHAGIIRLPDVPAQQRIEILRQLFAHHSPELEAGAIITVRGGKMRISGGHKPRD